MRNEDLQRLILEQLGLTPDEMQEPVPPADEEVRLRVQELLNADQAQAAAEVLTSWPDQAVSALRDALAQPGFIETILSREALREPFHGVVELLIQGAPDLIVKHVEQLSLFPAPISRDCVETAFQYSPATLAELLAKYVDEKRHDAIEAALIGIRKAVWKHGLVVNRDDLLYQSCLRVCAPDFSDPNNSSSSTTIDPALFVCQSFAVLAEVDLAQHPFFDLDNPHFKEMIEWLPSVVSNAAPELVRVQFGKAIEICQREPHSRVGCREFLPLAALKLGEECRGRIVQLLELAVDRQAHDLRGTLTRALAIIECGRDPLADACEAQRDGKFDALSKYEQALWLLNSFHGQVCNGGIFQFLFNSSGIQAYETLESLKLMGDRIGEKLLSSGIEVVMSELPDAESPHLATRQLSTSLLRKKYRERIGVLESAYYDQGDWNHRLYSFVLMHATQLRVT